MHYFGRGYFELYRGWLLPPEQTAAEIAFLLKLLRPRAGQRWLDVPCGYGRHLEILRKKRPGLKLAGGDLNGPYLAASGLARRLPLARCDLRRLPYASASFHAVLVLLNSFGYFDDAGNRQTLAELTRVLRPGGRLVLDLPNRRALIAIVRRQPMIRYCGGDYEATEHFLWDAEPQLLRNRTDWRWPGGQENSGYALRLYTPTQIKTMLCAAGLQIEHRFGDFQGHPFDPANSDRLLLIARKA